MNNIAHRYAFLLQEPGNVKGQVRFSRVIDKWDVLSFTLHPLVSYVRMP